MPTLSRAASDAWSPWTICPRRSAATWAADILPPIAPSPIKPLDQLLTEVERRLIETALRQARGNKSRAAEMLGISRPRLYRRIKELNLPDEGMTSPTTTDVPARLRSHQCRGNRKGPFTSMLRGLSALPFSW